MSIFVKIIFCKFRCRKECFDEPNSLFSHKAPSNRTMRNWFNEFNCERRSLKDEFREGPPKTTIVPEKADAVRELIRGLWTDENNFY